MKDQSQFWKTLWNSLPEVKAFLANPEDSGLAGEAKQALLSFISFLNGDQSVAGEQSGFLEKAAALIKEEWAENENEPFIQQAASFMGKEEISGEELLKLFFPEASFGGATPGEQEEYIRRKRTVRVDCPNTEPVSDPASQMIFTSNVLLTLPPEEFKSNLTDDMREKIKAVEAEEQKYWFDHPILMGIETDANEMIYGLRGLAESFRFEKERGNAPNDGRMCVILSLSVTHDGLKALAHEYLASELAKAGGLDDLDIYLFTEEDTQAVCRLLSSLDGTGSFEEMSSVFGVDGRYGRHYSFLKAVAPLWNIAVDDKVKGTFKIDLDQVFPQDVLVKETGKSAFDHFKTPLWGARGTDSDGKKVELGMIAGALVNEKDISKSLFTPDVPLPADDFELEGEARIFHKQHPMAVSTLAEMMTRYGEAGMPDGETSCLSRVHVTGGTNGILCSTIRKMRPFTPSFIGRAEDQAYLLSVLREESEPGMRYVHAPGLIMRHDKEAFAGASIAAAKLGTWVADLLRILYFSYYAAFLPGGTAAVKDGTDPFTGCFISPMPMTLIFLRLILKMLENPADGDSLLSLAELQLSPFVEGRENALSVEKAWRQEKAAWNAYYDALDKLEKESDAVRKTGEELKKVLLACRIN